MTEEGGYVEAAMRDGDRSWGWARVGGRRALTLAVACTCAVAVAGGVFGGGQKTGIRRYELVVTLPKTEKKVVRKAEDATLNFADSDVTEASIKAQQAAKKQYQVMIASALKAEAQAHKVGEKASELSIKAADNEEHKQLMKQQQRAMR